MTRSYNLKQLIPAVFMCLSLLWLTVCLPFVYDSQVKYAISTNEGSDPSIPINDEEVPLTNTTEEKASTSVTGQEEYLHHERDNLLLGSLFLSHKSSHNTSIYIAFYGELISPPPDFIS